MPPNELKRLFILHQDLIMNNRQLQPFVSSSAAIRQEIQRFESVHPSIYAIYDIIELIPDPLLAQQIREHVVCIEGAFGHF